MPPSQTVMRIKSPGDLVPYIVTLFGFRPENSVVVMYVRAGGAQLGLVLRWDLDVERAAAGFARAVAERMRTDEADGAFVVVFSDEPVDESAPRLWRMPHIELTDALLQACDDDLLDIVLVNSQDRWWSYFCVARQDDACPCGSGTTVDWTSDRVTEVAAAKAMDGHAVLPDRAAVARSVALTLSRAGQRTARKAIVADLRRHREVPRESRRLAMRTLLAQLLRQGQDPRSCLSDQDIAAFVALTMDVVVRDEVLVRAAERAAGEAILVLLREIARRTPPPYDAPVCSMLSWVAYSCGNGVVANVAIDRALSSDPDYPFAQLTYEAIQQLLPPEEVRRVMREAGDDMHC